ncbi:hypothetical protein C9926_01190 [Sulfurovum lithotrophicum]|nr:hypothetical protein C9926_01190 [Sulfurovum lithotrophicum]PTB88080.1 hypothetical protein C9925_00435 [cyanobacterium G8-9]
MIDFSEVMQRIRTVLSPQIKKNKVLDKDIALALQLDPQYYAVMKKRNKIPYESIAYFSQSQKLSMNWILLAQKPQYLT